MHKVLKPYQCKPMYLMAASSFNLNEHRCKTHAVHQSHPRNCFHIRSILLFDPNTQPNSAVIADAFVVSPRIRNPNVDRQTDRLVSKLLARMERVSERTDGCCSIFVPRVVRMYTERVRVARESNQRFKYFMGPLPV